MLKKVVGGLILLFLSSSSSFGQHHSSKIDSLAQTQWVDRVFNQLTPQQRIAQLFMVAAYSNRDEEHYSEIDRLITDFGIGGLIFFQGGPVRQAHLTNRYQAKSKVPLWLAMDAEWGIGMRLDSTISFPKQMTLGAIRDNRWIYEMGKEVANQFHMLDMHVNFAPVVDVNVNPKNPVIGYRSFGENPESVSEKGIAYMKGMQDHGVIANAKHFPGHGDTGSDSHYTLPVINHNRARMDSVELYPFQRLMDDSLMSVMVAHLQIPEFDSRQNTPTTLSPAVVTDLLKNDMQFDGLIFTDAMNMQGVAKYYDPGEADVKALIAGNDVILFPLDVAEAIRQIEKAIRKNTLTQASIDEHVRKILKAKYWAGLADFHTIPTDNLTKRLNNEYAEMLNRVLYQKALTVVDNSDELIPVLKIDSTSFASVAFGNKDASVFTNTLDKYANFDHFIAGSLTDSLLNELASHDLVVAAYQGITNSPRDQHKVKDVEIEFLRKLQAKTKVIVVAFGNAYGLQFFKGVNNILCTYEDNAITQNLAPQVIFGALQAEGQLPVSIGQRFSAGTGIRTHSASRLSYGKPAEVGMDAKTLAGIDAIMEEAIKTEATPGGQVLVAKSGKVVFQKNYGFQTYDSLKAVNDRTLYDIASITKVAATTQTLMYLEEQGILEMNEPIGNYLSELKGTNKENMVMRDILTHQAGLRPFIPYWLNTVEDSIPQPEFYSDNPEDNFQNYIVDELYGLKSMNDSIWKWTIDSELRDLPEGEDKFDYKYSDMGYYLFFRLAATLLNEPVDQFLATNFYKPLGLQTLTYLPLDKDFSEEIAPTEDDQYFRHTLICGTVHDQGAAMVGGVAGHAGLFSNANDLAILMQMNMQLGQYGGRSYFKKETVPQFASRQYQQNRRGMGWDKPITGQSYGPTSKHSSPSTFGHTGFTGTAAWADPENELIYIFLSNRVYPKAENRKLIDTDVRTRIQDLIYESIWNFREGS